MIAHACPALYGALEFTGLPGGTSGKEPACQCGRRNRCGFDPWVRKIPWRRARQPTPVLLPGESRGQESGGSMDRSLVAPQGRKELGMTQGT